MNSEGFARPTEQHPQADRNLALPTPPHHAPITRDPLQHRSPDQGVALSGVLARSRYPGLSRAEHRPYKHFKAVSRFRIRFPRHCRYTKYRSCTGGTAGDRSRSLNMATVLRVRVTKGQLMMRVGALLFVAMGLFLGALLAALAGVSG